MSIINSDSIGFGYMNCEEFVLAPLELSPPVVKESLRCLLHTILFSRSIGGDIPVEPITVKSEILGITYCRSGGDFANIVETRIRDFAQKLESSSSQSMLLTLSFYVPRQTKKSLWDLLSQPSDDKAVFERWKVQVDLTSAGVASGTRSPHIMYMDEDEQRVIDAASAQTKERVFHIIKRINERMDHLPAPPNDQLPYHFEISFTPSVRQGKGIHSLSSSPTSTPTMWSPKSIAQSIRNIPFIT